MRAEEKSFQRTIVFTMSAAAALFAVLLYLLFSRYMVPKFQNTEYLPAYHSAQTIQNIANSQIHNLTAQLALLADWSPAFSTAGNPHALEIFINENLNNGILRNEPYSFFLWLDSGNKPLFARQINVTKDAYHPLEPGMEVLYQKGSPLIPENPAQSVSGYITLNGRTMIVGSYPIFSHGHPTAPSGRLIAAGDIDESFIKTLSDTFGFEIFATADPGILSRWAEEADEKGLLVRAADWKMYQAVAIQKSLDGKDRFALYTNIPGEISATAEEMRKTFRIFLTFTILFFILSQGILLNHFLLKPLREIYRSIVNIRRSGRRNKVPVVGAELFKNLASEINAMTETLVREEAAHMAAESSNKAKSSFLITMSHEIRTPLNGVLGTADLLAGTELDTRQRMYVDTIIKSGNTLSNLLNDILDFSKIEAGKLELHYEAFELDKLVSSIANLMAPMAENKSLELLLQYNPVIPRSFYCDPNRLRQMITNLVHNAIKFTDNGYVMLHVDMKDRHVTIQVSDTGIGIAPASQKKLFQKFEQFDRTSTSSLTGTGLGLAITKELTGEMDGTITVSSELHKGTTFTLSLPLQPAGEQTPIEALDHSVMVVSSSRYNYILSENLTAMQAAVSSYTRHCDALRDVQDSGFVYDYIIIEPDPEAEKTVELIHTIKRVYPEPPYIILVCTHHQQTRLGPFEALYNAIYSRYADNSRLIEILKKTEDKTHETATANHTQFHMHLLVVEDNPINMMIATNMLQTLGCTLDTAQNGQEAVELNTKNKYDLIFMDCLMPVMDGYTATGHIRKNEEIKGLPHIPIIAMTANAMIGDREISLKAGIDEHITKPISIAILEKTLTLFSKPVQS